MTLQVVLGSGEMPIRELNAALTDLKKACDEAGDGCWFLIQAPEEPSATDKALVEWINKKDIWFETVGDGAEPDKIYADSQKHHTAKRLAPKVVELMNSLPEEGEAAQLLAVYVDSDELADPGDAWLNDVGAAVFTAGFPVKVLNDGLLPVDFNDGEAEELPTSPPPPAEEKAQEADSVKAKSKKSAGHTREELEAMERDDLIALAANLGITLPSRTRTSTYVTAILGEGGAPEAEVTPLRVVPDPVEEPDENDEDARMERDPEYAAEVAEVEAERIVAADAVDQGPTLVLIITEGTIITRQVSAKKAIALLGEL